MLMELVLFALAVAWGVHMAREQMRGASTTKPVQLQPSFKIALDGATLVSGPRDFVSGFGIEPSLVQALVHFPGPLEKDGLPASVREFLSGLHEQGGTRGAAVARLLFHDGCLVPSQALYFAVCLWPGGRAEMVAFVGTSPVIGSQRSLAPG